MEKQEDEICCTECGKLIKKDFTICPYCRSEIKNIEVESKKEPIVVHAKTKMSAILLVIFLGLFSWLYTWKKSASKFLVSFFVLLGILIIYSMWSSIIILWLLSFASIAMWLWALIDTAIKPDSFYTNYPNG